uniref:Reverse transcriptase domain-containing protein n=1 Tax=Tanacetum cinerariifolium TaxID=118510 RepID=A0A699KV44_TANCI|nr:reverse transcriptase domain-containing protein [Tanacetum cinerariifolium]
MDREIMRDPEREVGYRITDSWDEIVEILQGAPVSTDTELGGYMREFETWVRQRLGCPERLGYDRQMRVILSMKQMAPKRTTRSTADHETTNTTSVTNAQLQAMIDQGVTAALAARDALRSTNGDDSHNSRTGDLKVKGTDLASYTQRFQELALLCGRMFSEESDKIEKYIEGLPDMIHGSVVASKPKTMQEAIEIATELMDKKIRTFAERKTASKRKFENTSRNT